MSRNGVSLNLSGLRKSWGELEVLHGIDVDIEAGTFLSLLGPSGCGKSTALRLIAGLDEVSGGSIAINNKDVTHLPPAQRNIGMVFQNYALFPHMTVKQNILYGMKVRRQSKEVQAKSLDRVAEIMNLGAFLDRKPSQLSGGQQQRVALARVLVSNRPLVLMDEPLSNLDAKLRTEIRSEIRDLNRELGITVVYVTHDQSEALSMSDKILLMDGGNAVQFGTPEQLYNEPATIGVARFVGTPPMNVFSDLHLPNFLNNARVQSSDSQLSIGIRPHDLNLAHGPGLNRFQATVTGIEYEGSETLVRLRSQHGAALTAITSPAQTPERGGSVWVECKESSIRVFQTKDGKALPNQPNQKESLMAV
jgi:ABC-type sugar transport system ATPase subunit